MNGKKNDELERRYYTLDELLESYSTDGHQRKPVFIIFDLWIALPFIYSIYTLNGTMLMFVMALMIFDLWVSWKHKGTKGISGWLVKKRRIWLTGTKKMPRHYAAR